MTYYAALDVSLRSVHVCVIDEEGELVAETKLDSEVTDIVAWLHDLELDIARIGFEAGTLTQYLTYGLQAAGFEVICMEARQVKAALSAMRNKTDKHDARGIAQLLRCGWYSRVHVKSMASHRVRALLSSRKAVLSKCVDLENEIRGLFKVFGIKLPPKLGHGAFDAAVRDIIETDATLSYAMLPMLEVRLVLYRTFRELDNRTYQLAHHDPVCQRLMSAPGVGFITALTYKAGVDDPLRFKRSRTVGAHFGLTPKRYQSGEVDIDGRISRRGDREVRCALYTAANALSHAPVAGPRSKPGGYRWLKPGAIDGRSSPWLENSPSSCTVCGSTRLSSNGVRRAQGHEITAPSDPRRSVPAWTWSG